MNPADLKNARRRRAAPQDPRLDRLPPHSQEAEQGILGCILLSNGACIGDCIEKLPDGPGSLYDLRHSTLYQTFLAMYDERAAFDLITVHQRLKDDDTLDCIGGIAYLNALQDAVPSAANVSYYLDIVQEKYLLRRMVQTCTDVVGRVYDSEKNVDELLGSAERDLIRLTQSRSLPGLRQTKDIVSEAITQIESFFNRKGELSGLATGFTDLDRLTDGLQAGQMIVIAGRPSRGKTSLAMNIAENIVLNQKLPVLVFSLEMLASQLMLRMICSNSRVNLRTIREGFMTEADLPRLTTAAGRISSAPIYIDDSAGLTLMQLRARARRYTQQFSAKLIIIDYLQLLSTGARTRDGRQQEVSDISAGLKALAKELNVPVMILCQLNRDIEREKNRKPRLSDLRESGSIEQDADVVGMLYRVSKADEDDDFEEPDGVAINLLIAKQRSGPTGDVNLTFLKPYTRFENAAKVSNEDVPEEGALPYKESNE